MYLKKQDLDELNWKQLHGLTTTELEEFAQQHLAAHSGWLLPQIVANFGKWTLVHDGNQPNIQQTLAQNVGQDPKQQVLWRITRIPRSLLVKSQTKDPNYATLTPLILAGFKQYQGIGYEYFRGSPNLEWLVEPKLLEAMLAQVPCDLGSEKLLEIRNHGLMNKTGAKAGTLKPAETTWSLTGVKTTEIGHLPKLTQTMLTQIWLAHPAKRTQLMVLDPTNWDNMPEPLIKMELFDSTVKAVEQFKSQNHSKLLPWL